MLPTLTLPEEVLLLALDDDKGKVSMNASAALEYALAGGQLMELALAERLSLEAETVTVTDSAPLGDEVLDGVLARIAAERQQRKVKWWVNALHPRIKRTYLDRLVARGVVSADRHKMLGLLPTTRHTESSPEAEREIRVRLRSVLVDGVEPDGRTVGLVGLLCACSLERAVLPDKNERKRAQRRMKALTEVQPVSKAVTAIVNDINAAVTAAVVASTFAATST